MNRLSARNKLLLALAAAGNQNVGLPKDVSGEIEGWLVERCCPEGLSVLAE